MNLGISTKIHEEDNAMKKIKPAVVELCVVIGLLVVGICSLFRFDPGDCLSVSLFGKFELRNIDKVILASNGKEWTITDPDLIEQICDETRIADHVNPCSESSKRIDLYSGDRLVRSMVWAACCDTVEVYEPSITHWLFGGLDTESGYVVLSDKLVVQLNAIMKG